jgi:acylphosphatase
MVIHFQVRGRVQGVGFRWFVQREAAGLNLRGWVRNTDEGDVDVVASGTPDQIDALRASLRRGPRGSRVDHIQEDSMPETESLGPFRIDGAW